MPIPPTAGSTPFPYANVPRSQGALPGDLVQDCFSLLQKVSAVPNLPSFLHQRRVAGEFVTPMGKGRYGQDRGIMCPSFKSLAAMIYHFAQRGGAIALLPGPKNQIMRPGEGVDTVDLHKFQVTQCLFQLRAKR
jgi:hypothetical protein